MHKKLSGFCGVFLAMALIVMSSTPASAHPHVWIDIRSTLIMNDKGQVTAIEQEWLFDEFYTLFALEGLKKAKGKKEELLAALAKVNLENLHPYGYFMDIRSNGTKIVAAKVTEYKMEHRDDRLWLKFVVPLETAIDPKKERMRFSVFDPTYYIEMLHAENDVISFKDGPAEKCSAIVEAATPSEEAVSLAAALDQGAVPDNSLGALFAETVVVKCR